MVLNVSLAVLWEMDLTVVVLLTPWAMVMFLNKLDELVVTSSEVIVIFIFPLSMILYHI